MVDVSDNVAYCDNEDYKDTLHTTVELDLTWRERIKIMLGQQVTVTVDIATENIPGKTITIALIDIGR